MLPTNSSRSVLIVDKDVARREAIAAACAARGATVREADDPFSAMAAFGQQRFDVLCAYAGPRHLSLRGLFQLAKRKRHDIAIHVFVLPEDRAAVALSFEGEATLTELSSGVEAIADVLVGRGAPSAVDAPAPLSVPAVEPAAAAVPAPEAIQEITAEIPAAPAPELLPPPIPAPAPLVDEGPRAAQSSGSGEDFRGPPPGSAWDASSGAESGPVDLDAVAAVSSEGAPLVAGAEALIAAFAREHTGALVVRSDDARWVVYLYGGEPAWVDPPGGDARLFEELVGRGLLPVDARPEPVPEGQLLSSLIERGLLSAEAAQTFMRQVLFDAATEIAALESCVIESVEVPAFLETPPPFRVNPFGLVLESRRRRQNPDELLASSLELDDARVVPRGKLDKLYGKVAPFLRGVDVRTLLDGGSTLRGFREAAGVDAMLATQLVLALEAVGLVRIERATAEA